MHRDISGSPHGRVLVLNRGNLPSGLVQSLEEAGIRFQLASNIQDVDLDNATISCVLFPIRELPPVVVRQTVRRSASRYPVVVVDDAGNHHSLFAAGKAGARELLIWPCDVEKLPTVVRQSEALPGDESNGSITERTSLQLLNRLTERESQIVRGVLAGKVNKQIAADYCISQKTVEFHRSRAMKKLRVSSVAELVRLVMEADGRR
jgi:two-component system response regulator FixJ